jgi:hypothetical protein
MLEPRQASDPGPFALRAPEFWRDLILGMTWGIALVWASLDALDWNTFTSHLGVEIVSVGIPLLFALFSPRRFLTVFIGLCLFLFRDIFFIFLFRSAWSALATLVWLLFLIAMGVLVNRHDKFEEIRVPGGFRIVEYLLLAGGLGGGVVVLYLLRQSMGLSHYLDLRYFH